ncbi:YtxH domain-containing protein [Gelidibacter maritimus]|uniref:YtxH domain-containing protein n=1 Tax=Gelidibacter maritimus TaxID=2761487 RepID=A0A7W2M839_9FLAO|nr:YtxH domain-containing protein [Gelidibacter maritimus]MBA6154471.1 YtxH domain-containing protein [Gelidibacter maritimus]
MKKQQGKGLLALLGIGAGVFAWWKYKNLSPEQKEELHGKVNEVGQRVKDTYTEVESTVKTKLDELKTGAKKEVSDIQEEVNAMKN